MLNADSKIHVGWCSKEVLKAPFVHSNCPQQNFIEGQNYLWKGWKE